MQLNLIHNPATLTYEQFHAIDRDCFPNEPPLSFERFDEMRTNHLWAAFVHDDFAGYAYVIMKPQYVHLSRIAVGRQYQQKGIATELMRTLVGYGQHENKSQNSVPKRYQLQFVDNTGAVRGSCRLDPDFPGCSPFVVDELDSYLMDALIALERYLNPARDILKLTFSGEQLERTCRNLGFRLNYELVKMERTLSPGA